jgi:hypothetical protein
LRRLVKPSGDRDQGNGVYELIKDRGMPRLYHIAGGQFGFQGMGSKGPKPDPGESGKRNEKASATAYHPTMERVLTERATQIPVTDDSRGGTYEEYFLS